MPSQRDVKNKISSVKNIQKITRAMEMVAAARLRRAEQRIEALRPYADALRRMTRHAAQAAGAEAARVPLLREHESEQHVGILLVTGDRGLAGAFNSQVLRAGLRLSRELIEEGRQCSWYVAGRRGVSSLGFRGYELSGSYAGFADRPAHADARAISDDLIRAYMENRVDRVEILYNSYVSPLTQKTPSRPPRLRRTGRPGPRRPTTSPSPRRSCAGSYPTTWSSRSIVRSSSRPRASSVRR
jgi:F-type H+-transporting ATPase subunit gamma